MSQDCLYVLRHNSSGLIKIGVTSNWQSRSKQLRVNLATKALLVVACEDNLYEESSIHCEYDEQRIPQTEWFHLDANQTQTLLHRVKKLGKEVKWRPGDVKPKKPRRKARQEPDLTVYFTKDQMARWKEKLLAFSFVPYVAVHDWGIFVYGREMANTMPPMYPRQIAAIMPTDSDMVSFEHTFNPKNHTCLLDATFATWNEEEFFETLEACAEKHYFWKEEAGEPLVAPGYKACVPSNHKFPSVLSINWRLVDGIRQFLDLLE